MGPWTLAYHVFGVEPFLLATVDDPPMVMDMLHRLKQFTIKFGIAQIEAGADALTLPDHATGDLVSGEYYRRFLMDMHHEFVEDLPVPLILHICGSTTDRMPYIATTGMAAFHFDSKNDPQEAMDAVRRRHQPSRQPQQPCNPLLKRHRGTFEPKSSEPSTQASK